MSAEVGNLCSGGPARFRTLAPPGARFSLRNEVQSGAAAETARVPSIRARIALLAAAVGIVLLALQGYTATRQYRHSRDAGVAEVIALAERAAAATSQVLLRGRTTLESLASRRGRQLLDPERCAAEVPAIMAAAPFFSNVVVTAANGDAFCSAVPPADLSALQLADRQWFPELLESRAFTISSPYTGILSGRTIVVLAAPVLDDEGSILGVIAASMGLEDFQSIAASAQSQLHDLVTIADAGRMIVARTSNPREWVGRELPPPQVATPSYTLDGRPYTRTVDAEGVMRVWGEVGVSNTGWMVYGAVPVDVVFGPARALAATQLLWALGLVAIAALLAAWTYRGIGQPLVLLADGARRTATDSPLPIPSNAPREVRSLAGELNRMLEARTTAREAERLAWGHYRALFDHAAVGIYRSSESGRFLDVNPALVRLLGYESADELKAVPAERLYRDPHRRRELIEQHRGEPFQDVEVEWVGKDGTPVTLLLSGRVVSDRKEDRIYEVFARDVTRERALSELSRHQQKMEALGRIAGGLSHEFNNLLTVISVNAEILRTELEATEQLQEAEEIRRAAERGSMLTRKLLAFSRPELVVPQLVDVNQAVQDSEAMLRRAAGEHVDLVIRLDPEAPCVRLDPGHLDQALLNLVLNARDAMPMGGRTTIATEARCGGDAGPLGVELPYTVLSVSDEGTGMTPEVVERAFEPFFTTKDAGKGTGLGLATVHGIAKEAGGFAKLVTRPGEGCRVELWLPSAVGDEERSA